MINSRIAHNKFILDYLMDISEGEWVMKRNEILELREEVPGV